MTSIDYSKDDMVSINQQLFRKARNNLSKEQSIPIREDKDLEKNISNLQIYGSELINNLNQINYTFNQLETYLFIPSKATRQNIKRIKEEGVNVVVGDIKEPTAPLEEGLEQQEPLPPIQELGLEGEELPPVPELDLEGPPAKVSDTVEEKFDMDFGPVVMPTSNRVKIEIPKVKEQKFQSAKKLYKLLDARGVQIAFRDLDAEKLLTIIERYNAGVNEGAGRRLKGGAVKVKTPKKGKAKAPPTPEEDEKISNALETLDPSVAGQVKTNLDLSEVLDDTLITVSNAKQNTPVPAYLTKINELMTSLIQFIGRTTVLYITRILKNINYLDEEQIRLIYSSIQNFKGNLDILERNQSKGGALIKDTLYTQVKKETEGLYNIINNSIRNISKLKDYTIFSDKKLEGGYFGYFNDGDLPRFAERSPTKRFL
jgi:hypothetical protein